MINGCWLLNLSGSFTDAAEIVGLLLAAFIAAKAYRQFNYACVSLDLLAPSIESYVQRAGTEGNANSTNPGARQLSHSLFRLNLKISASHKVKMRGAVLYAYHRDMARQWAELSPITLPVLSNDEKMQRSIQDFVRRNSREHVSGSVILDNGVEKYDIELSAGKVRQMVVARLGGFILPLPERSRIINGMNFCDVLLRLNINAVAAAFLVCLPRHDAHDECGPIVSDFKIFRRAKTIDVLTWATKVRPQTGAEGGRRTEKFWVKLHEF